MTQFEKLVKERFSTQAAFARAIGWSRQKVNAFLKSGRMPNVEEINLFARALSVEVGELLDIFL